MSIDLKSYLQALKDQELEYDNVEYFPSDYDDTYNMGARDGKIKFAQELWKLLGFEVEM